MPPVRRARRSTPGIATSARSSTRQLHAFYDQLCPDCAAFNFTKRTELADLRGRVALLTGGRVKIGYQAGLKLLRSGAHLIVTTRFPRDSAMRYAREPDFAEWSDRLEIFGLDLRHTPSVESFCHQLLTTRSRLDFIVNNACQTVRRPPEFYAHMMAAETAALDAMPAHVRKIVGAYEGLRGYHMLPETSSAQETRLAPGRRRAAIAGLTHAAELSQVPLLPEELLAQKDLFPEGQLDQDLQQVDLRGRNSWRLAAGGGVLGRTARSAAGECGRAVRPQRPAEAADAAHARPRQAHRQRVGGRRAVLSQLQDDPASAHEHGEGGAEHDDAHVGHRLSARRHPHEQRGHRLGDRRGSGGDRQRGRPPSTGFIRRSTSSMAPPESSIRSSTASTPALTCGDSS